MSDKTENPEMKDIASRMSGVERRLNEVEDRDNTRNELLIRIDERLNQVIQTLEKTTKSYITKQEFEPVKQVVYGLVVIVLVGVAGAILRLVITP
jgi:hypothetical protein